MSGDELTTRHVFNVLKSYDMQFGAWSLRFHPGTQGAYELVAKRPPRQSVTIDEGGTLKVGNMPALINTTDVKDISDADLMQYIDALGDAFNKATAELCRRAEAETKGGNE